MNEELNTEETVSETTAEEQAEKTEETAAPETEETPADPVKELQKQIEALNKALTEKDDKYLRLAAEYDNFRRRTVQERLSVYTDAVNDSVKEILPILDDLERAAGYTEADKVAEGLGIIAKSAQNALTKLGVTAFGTAGENFDASLHNAVMHVEDESLGENVITDVFQKGYKKGDKVIRYAMVKVAN